VCNLRFDDTNPDTEDTEYVDAIVDDWRWLGYEPSTTVLYASDYFEQLYQWAEHLITTASPTSTTRTGDDLARSAAATASPVSRARTATAASRRTSTCSADARRRVRRRLARAARQDRHAAREHAAARPGDVPHPPRAPPPHGRPVGASTPPTTGPTARATRSRASPTRCARSSSTATAALRLVPRALPLPFDQPRQIEFARLELTHTVTSKRKLAKLVADGIVEGWDDPRLPTLRALRRRGYPSTAIKEFCSFIGVAEDQQPSPDRAARELRAQRAQPQRAASHGRAAPAQAGRSPTGPPARSSTSPCRTTRRTRRRHP
jgi:glutaminyl-tRNA synthetase